MQRWRFSLHSSLFTLVCALVLAVASTSAATDDPTTGAQLETVRAEITRLEEQLAGLTQRQRDVSQEREKLNVQLQLAEARVRELELLVAKSHAEVGRLRAESTRLAADLEVRRQVLARHIEMLSLLGQPGPLQLLYDAAHGGDLERAVGTVAVLTTGQARLMIEYDRLRQDYTARLAQLSQALEVAERETRGLDERRHDLEGVRRRVEAQLAELERSRRQTTNRLADLRDREGALERLLGILGSRDRLTGHEDIRGFRGALPWPSEGPVVLGFGRHYIPRYSTYTVCNGVRLNPPSGTEVQAVFPGMVAYARYFKGYGNMVVIDHGNDVYSLVAGLATIHVRLNQTVTMGMRLGLAAPPTEEGSLYVEIRVGGKPQDPLRWLQLKGEHS